MNERRDEPVTAARVLELLDGGTVNGRMSAELERLAGAVARTQKKGKVTLEVTVKPLGDGIEITGAVKVTTPLPAPVGTFYWVTRDGKLSRHDPEQLEMDLRPLPKGEPAGVVDWKE